MLKVNFRINDSEIACDSEANYFPKRTIIFKGFFFLILFFFRQQKRQHFLKVLQIISYLKLSQTIKKSKIQNTLKSNKTYIVFIL